MRKLFLLSLLVLFGAASYAQDENKVAGIWLTQDGDSKVTVSKNAKGKFNGVITWLKEPMRDGKPKVDHNNPDPKLQSRPTMGLPLLEGFVYNKEDKEWVDGTIYDPKTGKTYKCYMWFEEDSNILHVKGFIGFAVIGKEVLWTRTK